MNNTPGLINHQEEVIDNIKRFCDELEGADKSENKALHTLIENIPRNRAWYFFYDESSKKYKFAPSKYIGYESINAEMYYKSRHLLDGRNTESVLSNWYEQISKGHPNYEELSTELKKFCSKYGKKPNSLFRINILIENKNKDSIENDVVELIWKIYLGLSNENKDLLKSKMNKLKL